MKPTVRYINKAEFVKVPNSKQEYAFVTALDHPVLGYGEVRTSLIVKKMSDGSFETLNTVYVPTKEAL